MASAIASVTETEKGAGDTGEMMKTTTSRDRGTRSLTTPGLFASESAVAKEKTEQKNDFVRRKPLSSLLEPRRE